MDLPFVSLSLVLFSLFGSIHCDNAVCVKYLEALNSDTPCLANLVDLDAVTHFPLSDVNTVISVKSTTLSAHLKFDGFSNLTIEGANRTKMSIVTCTSKDSGLYFSGVQGLMIRNLVFVGCGASQHSTTTDLLSSGQNETAKFKSALYIWKSTDVSIVNTGIHNSSGLGLSVFDTNGTVTVRHSTFEHNHLQLFDDDATHIGGGGVYIEFTTCPPGKLYGTCEDTSDYKTNSQYTIDNCVFESNWASTSHPEKSSFVKLIGTKKLTNFQGLARGGGLAIKILGSASGNSFSIKDSKFYNNRALSGGGLSIKIAGKATKNSVEVVNCKIVNNTSDQNGGGIDVGYRLSLIRKNKVSFTHCLIKENHAKSGGGTLLLWNNLGDCNSGQNSVEFTDCIWMRNSAEYGAAFDGTVYAPKGAGDNNIMFKTCSFKGNKVNESETDMGMGVQTLSGRGTFKMTNMVVTFCHSVHFENNTGTALWAVASRI